MTTCTVCGSTAGPFRPQRRQCEPCRLAHTRRYTAARKQEARMPKPAPTTALSDAWNDYHGGNVSIELAREEFLSNTPAQQAERIAEVRRLIRQRPKSYLAAHAREIYGI